MKKETSKRDEEITNLKGQNQTKEFLVQKLKTDLLTQTALLHSAQDDLRDWKTSYTQLQNQVEVLKNELEKLNREVELQRTRNKELEQTTNDCRDRAAQAEKDRDSYQIRHQESEDELVKAQKSLAELESQFITQAKDLQYYKGITDALQKQGVIVEPITALIEGKVTAVSETTDIVVVSVGSNDKVAVGIEFTVYRGDKYIGKIKVDKVGKDWAGAHSLKDFQADKIRVGDNVSTSVY